MFKKSNDDALDLLKKLLEFNPKKRLTVDQALRHRYLKEFNTNLNEEFVMSKPIEISIDDNNKFSVKEYREALY